MGSNQNSLKFDAVAENFAYFQTKPSMLILKGYISIYLKKLASSISPCQLFLSPNCNMAGKKNENFFLNQHKNDKKL